MLLLATTACGETKVSLGQEFSLYMGETADMEGEELQIRFLDVVEDSRCPTGVTCVWEGRVSCMVEITYLESLHRVALTQPGLTSWPAEKPFLRYQIEFRVEPYPEAGKEIEKDEYQLVLRVTKHINPSTKS
jgi:hypothetical protein